MQLSYSQHSHMQCCDTRQAGHGECQALPSQDLSMLICPVLVSVPEPALVLISMTRYAE